MSDENERAQEVYSKLSADFKKKILYNPTAAYVYESLCAGADPFSVIEALVEQNSELCRQNLELGLMQPSPVYIDTVNKTAYTSCSACAQRTHFDQNVEIKQVCKRYCIECGRYVNGPRAVVEIKPEKPTIGTKSGR